MNGASITVDLGANIVRSTQEAVALAHRLGFGQQQSKIPAERQTTVKFQTVDSLNNGVLFCWCDDGPGG